MKITEAVLLRSTMIYKEVQGASKVLNELKRESENVRLSRDSESSKELQKDSKMPNEVWTSAYILTGVHGIDKIVEVLRSFSAMMRAVENSCKLI